MLLSCWNDSYDLLGKSFKMKSNKQNAHFSAVQSLQFVQSLNHWFWCQIILCGKFNQIMCRILPKRSYQKEVTKSYRHGGLMVNTLDSRWSSPGLMPGRDIALCSWARHFTLTVPLYNQVYKWVPASLILGVTLRWTSIPSRGSRNTPSRFMIQKPGKHRPDGHLAGMQTLPTLPHPTLPSPTLPYSALSCPTLVVVFFG